MPFAADLDIIAKPVPATAAKSPSAMAAETTSGRVSLVNTKGLTSRMVSVNDSPKAILTMSKPALSSRAKPLSICLSIVSITPLMMGTPGIR